MYLVKRVTLMRVAFPKNKKEPPIDNLSTIPDYLAKVTAEAVSNA